MSIARNILIAPLDWGLGHTTRCIPVIQELLLRGHRVTMACNDFQRQFVESYDLNIRFVHLEGYDVSYHNKGSMVIKMAGQIPKILQKIKEENNWVKQYVKDNEVDLIISDNRFGFYQNLVESIYLTHQINIQANSFVNPVLFRLHDMMINNFHHCWIPDTPENEFAGNLSISKNKSFRYIGILSRFHGPVSRDRTLAINDFTAILSGPEPQRTIFEQLLIKMFSDSNHSLLLVGGTLKTLDNELPDNITYKKLSAAQDINKVLSVTNRVIARSGYSTIMDLAYLQLPVYFVPTPGQTEQEYLARFHANKSGVNWTSQAGFSKPEVQQFKTISKPTNSNSLLLKSTLDDLGL
jgi:uncharacterized protein (TIGR00661 family)